MSRDCNIIRFMGLVRESSNDLYEHHIEYLISKFKLILNSSCNDYDIKRYIIHIYSAKYNNRRNIYLDYDSFFGHKSYQQIYDKDYIGLHPILEEQVVLIYINADLEDQKLEYAISIL